jgi:DNA-binding beta-propeller fold protein YncE
MKRFLWLGFVLFLYLICTGCGDTFRPIIIPNPPVFPNPAATNTVVSINNNAPLYGGIESSPGSAMVIDVSGDTDQSQANVGLSPVHAVQQSASVVLVANQSITGAQSDSITKLIFDSPDIFSSSTISLPTNSAPSFVATTETAQAYVLLPDYLDPTTDTKVPSVGIINTSLNSLVAVIPVGNTPVAMAETPDGKKLYVANQGDSTISGFNTQTANLSPRTGSPTSTSSPPIWLAARSDSQMVYVLEADGTLAALNTFSTSGPDTLTEYPNLNVPGATSMVYDGNLNRLYIAGGQEMEIIFVGQSPPQLLATINIPAFTPLNSAPVTAIAAAVTDLPDGSRAYVSSYAVLPSNFTVTSVSGDGVNATYAYTLTSGQNLTTGVSVTVTGTGQDGFDGNFVIDGIISGTTACPGTCFQVPNTAVLASTPVSVAATGSNVFPQVTVVWTNSNTIKTTAALPGFPDATNQTYLQGLFYVPICTTTRDVFGPTGSGFRFNMAPGGDSTRAYLSTCDGGVVDIIDTSTDTYILNQAEPASARPPIASETQNPSQNPIFLLAGP